MTAKALRRTCLRMSGAVEEFPFGERTSVFKVAKKVFALSALRSAPLQVSVKCDPDLAEQLRDAYPNVVPGYHLNKRHWNTVTIDDDIPAETVVAMVEDSYDLIVSALPRATRQRLGWTAGD